MREFLGERLTFDRLFRLSEPKRVRRSDTVRGPPLEIFNAKSGSVYHTFNFKSFPSTTGLRHHGYIRFFRPHTAGTNRMPLQHVPCEVDCTCPDFRYRFAWVLKQKGSARVGPQSMNQAWNKAPNKTNPDRRASLCKHILAARDYIYGMLADFRGAPSMDTSEVLGELVKYANRRWTDWQGQSQNAKEREAWFKAAKAARAAGQPPPPGPPEMYRPAAGPVEPRFPPGTLPPEDATLPPERPKRPERPKAPELPKAGKPKPRPLAIPPGERGRQFPFPPPPTAKPKGGATPPGKRGRGLPPLGRGRRESLEASVDRVNGSRSSEAQQLMTESMTNLQEAIKVVEEIEQDELAAPTEAPAMMPDAAVDTPPPSEPPVDDTAVGADTEGNVVLGLLTDIKNLLTQLVAVESPEAEMPPEEGEEGEEMPVDALPEPPEGEGEEGAEGEEEDEEDEDEEMERKGAPVPPEG